MLNIYLVSFWGSVGYCSVSCAGGWDFSLLVVLSTKVVVSTGNAA